LAVVTGFKDPITFEVFKNGLIGLADEMGLVTLRTSHSPTLSMAMDFSTAFCDPQGQVLAQGNSMMIHVGTFPDAMTAVLEKYAGRIYPGDVYIFNEMDAVAQHLNDLYVVKPCFIGDELIGFGVSTAHHVDVGGSVPGSMDITASEIFQEGLQIPLVKLYEKGRLSEAVMDILMRNVRLPALYSGDLEGQVAALHAGETGLIALVERYSLQGFRELSRELLDYTERLTQAAIARIPDGTYEFEDWIDDDGVNIDHDPVSFRVKIIVSGDEIIVDWAGTAPQVESSINVHITNTRSVSYGVLMGAFQEEIPSNQGFYRRVTVRAPEGSIVNAKRPAARGFRGLGSCYRMIDTLLGALHKAVPDRIPAAGDGGPGMLQLTGTDPVHGRFVEMGMGAGSSGWGGRPGLDGIDYVSPFGANVALRPIESTEQEGRLRIERMSYEPDTGGAGRWRGCLSLRTEARILVDGVVLRLRTQRQKTRAYGLAGGKPGTPSSTVLNPGRRDETSLPQTAIVKLKKNDLLQYIHSSGGGFGDPFLRDPQAVLADVLDEKITAAYAKREYGVAIDLGKKCVDERETRDLRAAHKKDRLPSTSSARR
jgi:N-methylhydantoinase B